MANGEVGERLIAQVAAQTGGAPLAGAAEVGLATPIDIESTVYNPLPNGTGNGLSAFYYALLAAARRVHRQHRGQHAGGRAARLRARRIRPGVPLRRAGQNLAIPDAAAQVGHHGAAGAAHLGGLPGHRPRARHAHRSWLATLGVRGVRDRRGGHHVQFVALGAGLDGPARQHADLRDPRIAVGGRHRPAGGDAAVLPLAGRIRADAPGFPGRCARCCTSRGTRIPDCRRR